MTAVTQWWWVRHAPVRVHGGKIYGQQDLPCDCSDTALVEKIAATLPQDAVCITTPLQRTRQTADALIAAGWSPSEQVTINAFVEQDFGDWQGLTHDQFDEARDGIGHRYWLAPAFERAPNGESFTDVIARVAPAVTKLSSDYSGRPLVAITHGGTIRAALTFALGLDPERALSFSVHNYSVTHLDHIAGDESHMWRVNSVNWLPAQAEDA